MQANQSESVKSGDKPKLPAAQAAGVLLVAVVLVGVYAYLAHLLGLIALFAGNMVLFYWAGIDHFKLKALPAVVLGSLGGILNGSLFALLPALIDEGIGALIALLVLLAAIYCLIMQWLPLVFNNPYMLQLNVALIPAVLGEGRFIEMGVAVLFSAAFWGGLVLAGARIVKARTSDSASTEGAGYSVQNTEVGTLLDDPAAAAVLDKHMPGFSKKDTISQARPYTLSTLRMFVPSLSNEILAAIDNDLKKLPPQK